MNKPGGVSYPYSFTEQLSRSLWGNELEALYLPIMFKQRAMQIRNEFKSVLVVVLVVVKIILF